MSCLGAFEPPLRQRVVFEQRALPAHGTRSYLRAPSGLVRFTRNQNAPGRGCVCRAPATRPLVGAGHARGPVAGTRAVAVCIGGAGVLIAGIPALLVIGQNG